MTLRARLEALDARLRPTRAKHKAELAYWQGRVEAEGLLGHTHYERAHTEAFGLERAFFAGKRLLAIADERASIHQAGPRCWPVREGTPPATSRPRRPNQRRSQRRSRLIRRGHHETRRASWGGGLRRAEMSSRGVAWSPEPQTPPNWVWQAPHARRFRTKAARSARWAVGIWAVAARCSRQYAGRVPGT